MNPKPRFQSSVDRARRLNLLVVLALLLSLVGSLTAIPMPVQAKKDEVLRADPRLLQLAAEHPDDVFRTLPVKFLYKKQGNQPADGGRASAGITCNSRNCSTVLAT